MRADPNPYLQLSDEYFMYEALQESIGGIGWTSPNPLVGCVIVREGEIIGRGHHQRYGELHAEVMAIRNCGGDCAGTTAYINLEPCTHVAHQGSCCRALAEAGVSRVVYAIEDADPRTADKALIELPQAGIEVTSGILARESAQLLDYYLWHKVHRLPFIHLKLALSLDAKIACANGVSQWLSGPESLGYAHFLRQKYDAVLVGIGTVLSDNPRLTARPEVMSAYRGLPDAVAASNPVRVILDPRFETLKAGSELNIFNMDQGGFRDNLPRVVVAGSLDEQPEPSRIPAGVTIAGLEASSDRLQFSELFRGLWDLGITSVLVEGGSGVAAELIKQKQVNKLGLVFTPGLIGSDAMGFSPELGLENLDGSIRLKEAEFKPLGADLLVSGKLDTNQS